MKTTQKYKQSRIAKLPVALPKGVTIDISDSVLSVKGAKDALSMPIHPGVEITEEDGQLLFNPVKGKELKYKPMAGTMRALAQNMMVGVVDGFEKKLELVGVGYRAQLQGKKINFSLGFSHPVEFEAPEGITFEVPSQTEILIKGADKQKVGACAAKIRALRPPEPYKGKGVRYANERISLKEAKKK